MGNSDDKFKVIPIGDPHYAAIGLVASNWARLERFADEAIWELLQTNPALSACVTAQMMGLRPRFLAIQALLRSFAAPDKDIDTVDRLLRRSYELANERNRIVHDPWFYNIRTDARARYAATVDSQGRPTLAFIEVPKDDLNRLAQRVHDFAEKAFETFDNILQPLRDKHPQWRVVARG